MTYVSVISLAAMLVPIWMDANMASLTFGSINLGETLAHDAWMKTAETYILRYVFDGMTVKEPSIYEDSDHLKNKFCAYLGMYLLNMEL